MRTFAVWVQDSMTDFEINPVLNRIRDLRERSEALRGYL